MLTLYGALLSPFVRKVRIVLAEKKVEYELVPQSPFEKSAEFLKKSPLGRIPALDDEQGRSLADSSIIAEYLEERFPEPALLPRDPYERARVRWFDEYADGGMAPTLTGKIFFQRVVNTSLMKNKPDEAALADGIQELARFFTYLEDEIDGNDYLVGNTFSLADISVGCQLINLRHAHISIDAAEHPTLRRWFDRVTSRPSIAALIEQDQGFLGHQT